MSNSCIRKTEKKTNSCIKICFGHHKKKPEKQIKRHMQGPKWRELSGELNWEGLLDPLDTNLRKTIIHYGEMAQSTYDAFNTEKASKFAGDSLYAKKGFFSKVGLEKGNPYKYRVTKFLYAESNWIGFVAVATDEGKDVLGRRDIVIAWRGTVRKIEWVNDFEFGLVSADKVFGQGCHVKVHQGWYSIYTKDDPLSLFNKTSARDQVFWFFMFYFLKIS